MLRLCGMALGFILLLLPSHGWASEAVIGTIKSTTGQAFVLRGDHKIVATSGLRLSVKDTLVTGDKSTLGLILRDNSTLSMGPRSKLELADFVLNVPERDVGFFARIYRGTMVYASGLMVKLRGDSVKFRTPVAVAGVRGTTLAISVEADNEEE